MISRSCSAKIFRCISKAAYYTCLPRLPNQLIKKLVDISSNNWMKGKEILALAVKQVSSVVLLQRFALELPPIFIVRKVVAWMSSLLALIAHFASFPVWLLRHARILRTKRKSLNLHRQNAGTARD
jgi:hypothetical protein